MNNTNDNTNNNPPNRYNFKIIDRYRFEILTVVCPHCYGMTNIIEGIEDNKCSNCSCRIEEEDLSNEIL